MGCINMEIIKRILTLYIIEVKKIITKKSVWISAVIGVLFILLVGITNLSSDGHTAYVKQQEKLLTEISGEEMDDSFFEQFKADVNAQINSNPEMYAKLYEFDPGTVFMNAADAIGERALYDFVFNVVRDRSKIPNITADEFYELMRANVIKDGLDLGCSEQEVDEWLKEYDSINKPIEYSYAQAYKSIMDVQFLVGWILFLSIAIALAGVFADEKTFRTDALILSARNGRIPVCAAKLLAGISVSVAQTAFLLGLSYAVMAIIFGGEGWNAAIQNVIPPSPWSITVGSMMLRYFGLALITSVLFAVTNMALSFFTQSAVATMAIEAALLFAGLFNVPSEMTFISKLWQLKPTMVLHYGTFTNLFMYGRLNNIEMTVLICVFLIAAVSAGLIWAYKQSQLESR